MIRSARAPVSRVSVCWVIVIVLAAICASQEYFRLARAPERNRWGSVQRSDGLTHLAGARYSLVTNASTTLEGYQVSSLPVEVVASDFLFDKTRVCRVTITSTRRDSRPEIQVERPGEQATLMITKAVLNGDEVNSSGKKLLRCIGTTFIVDVIVENCKSFPEGGYISVICF